MRRLTLSLLAMIPLGVSADPGSPPSCRDLSVDPETLSDNVSETSLAAFDDLEIDMPRETVLAKVGEPTFLCGSGLSYDVYRLDDGVEVWIGYLEGAARWAFVTGDYESEKRALFGER